MVQIRRLPDELQNVAAKELGEVESRIPEDLQALKTWIKQQPHLKARTDDQLLIQFLRGCKYSLEKAKNKLDLYYSLKTKYPQMFNPTDVDSPKFREVHNLALYTPLPKPLFENEARIWVCQLNYSADHYHIEDMYHPSSAMFELSLLNDPFAGVHGIILIFDYSKVTYGHLAQFTPNFLKRVVSFLENSMPFRIRAAYFTHVPSFAQLSMKLILSLVSEKIRKRLFILGSDIKELSQHIPLEYLPMEYGGKNGSMKQVTQDYHKVFDEYREYFKENANYGTDETKRPGKPLDLDGLFGVGGSFRKLDVD
ncbi:alpha-tocopherol transfer protein-like [Stomoxys calcitrans]|uniref:alpha-tocopherol transfer protein-like n=1 Tax=Stomoxys calcitrans TaxID=35570 RepID=UPI0027E2CFC0|nr:alpha-tocopherol transfer protein-like [Stomoxys calcitrans]